MKTSIHRRHVLASLAALGAGALGSTNVLAQDAFPSKGPIKVILPLPAGGAADATARVLTAAMQTQMKQSFVIDNRPGGSFVIAMQAIAQAPADGYTLLYIYPGMVAAQVSLKKFDMPKTLTPVSLMGTMPAVLVAPASSPYKTLKEMVDAGAAKAGSLNYGSVGPGTIEHLWCSEFSKHNRMDAVHVPFKGMPDATTALVSGEIQYLPLAMALALQFAQKGMLRPLAVLDTKRHPAMPNVPTIKEAGFDEPPLVFWGGLAVPKGTPAAIVERLRSEIATAVANDEVKGKLSGMGTTPFSSPSAQSFEDLISSELKWLTEAVKNANLQLN